MTFEERCDLIRSTVLRSDMTAKERFEILKKRYSYSEISYYEERVYDKTS